ncbi:hypothetical protein [Falsibacillus pallidus]|uniref:hypothetical protein n=1 Tax=Falsibacillus pallidus TaxID=493781 RepID=UPI003D969273
MTALEKSREVVENSAKLPTFEEYVAHHGELMNVEEFRKKLKMTRALLFELIESGHIPRSNMVIVNEDVLPKKNAANAKVYFHKNWAENFKREDIGHTLKEIADTLGISYRWLREVSSNKPELFEEGRISHFFWDMEWFKRNIQFIHEKTWAERGNFRKGELFDMLTDDQQKWINSYLIRREKGEGILVGRKIEWSKKPVKPQKALEDWKSKLALIFYRIICGRAGIKDYHVTERLGKLRDLTDEELQKFNEEKEYFKIIDFSPADINYIKKGYKTTSFGQLNSAVLTPFLYFVLSELKEEWVELRQKAKSGRYHVTVEEVEKARENFEDFEIAVETALSKAARRNDSVDSDEEISVFLTHEEILKAKEIVRNADWHDPMKKTLIFMFGALVGIRPDEFAHLKIQDFDLDKNTHLLKRYRFDEEINDLVELSEDDPHYLSGYGRLWIEYNKGGYSMSHSELGTLIVPRLVTLINLYLKSILYKNNPSDIGKGYLIRPKNELPNQPYTSAGISRWLSVFSREHFLFLSDEPIDRKRPDKTPRNSFKYYDLRHTVYNLLIKTPVPELEPTVKERAAQIHVRHDIRKKQGNTGRAHYTSDISLKDYYTAIDRVLNFPWELGQNKEGQFYDWMRMRGLLSFTEEETAEITLQETPKAEEKELNAAQTAEVNALETQLQEHESLAAKLSKGPSGKYKEVNSWVKKTVELDKEIKAIKQKINLLKQGDD